MSFDEETTAALDYLMAKHPVEPYPALPNWRQYYHRPNEEKLKELASFNPFWREDHLEGIFDEEQFLNNIILTRKVGESYLIHVYSLFGAMPVANPGSIAGRVNGQLL